jgi:hypothetical protein
MTKPMILIYVFHPNPKLLQEICAGIEEEGVSYEVVPRESNDVAALAYESSNASVLGTGIVVSSLQVILTLSSLPKGSYVFQIEETTLHQARILGTNAARAVKRKPFKEITSEVTI